MVNPQGMILLEWADTILVDFPEDNIPMLLNKEQWRQWGDDLVTAISFVEAGAPYTIGYKDWFSWAQDVYYTMLNSA